MGYRPRPKLRDESLSSVEKDLKAELKELERQAESYKTILDAWAPVKGAPTPIRVVTEMMLDEVQDRIREIKLALEKERAASRGWSDWGGSATFQDVSEAVVSLDVPPPTVSNDTRPTVELLDDFPD